MDKQYYGTEFAEKRNIWLKEVSRTFYPSIKILPKDLHFYVGHSYLICRLLDTLEDAYDITVEKKKEALHQAVLCIKNPSNFPGDNNIFAEIASTSDIKPFEKVILENAFEVFECLDTFPDIVKSDIRDWTTEMADGMKKYSRTRQAKMDQKKIKFDIDELEENLKTELKNTLVSLDVAFDNLEVARAGIVEAQENIRVTDLGFSQGIGTSTDVLDAILNLSRAKFNLINAYTEVFESDFRLRRLIEADSQVEADS